MRKHLTKYLHRLTFAVFTFLVLEVTSMDGVNIISSWTPLSTAHLVFVVVVVMVLWDLTSFLFHYLDDKLIPTKSVPFKLSQKYLQEPQVTRAMALSPIFTGKNLVKLAIVKHNQARPQRPQVSRQSTYSCLFMLCLLIKGASILATHLQ